MSGEANGNAFGVPGDGAGKKCDTVLPGQALHWTEQKATGDWGPYEHDDGEVGPMTQAGCIAACEAHDECAAWTFDATGAASGGGPALVIGAPGTSM